MTNATGRGLLLQFRGMNDSWGTRNVASHGGYWKASWGCLPLGWPRVDRTETDGYAFPDEKFVWYASFAWSKRPVSKGKASTAPGNNDEASLDALGDTEYEFQRCEFTIWRATEQKEEELLGGEFILGCSISNLVFRYVTRNLLTRL